MEPISFSRDLDFHDPYPINTYLDLNTGNILFVYKIDCDTSDLGISEEENKSLRQQISKTPDGFLKIPGMSHGQHHEILKCFIESRDKDEEVGDYFGSIGGWKKTVRDETWFSYQDFKEKKIGKSIEAFMTENTIEPEWH